MYEQLCSVLSLFSGFTAGQVCYCPKVKKQLPTKLQSALERNKSFGSLKPGLQDKDAIFRLASNPKSFYELQKKLQVGIFSRTYIQLLYFSVYSQYIVI